MKNLFNLSSFLLLFVLCTLCFSCEKDPVSSSCETVAAGNQFLKVVNKSGGQIFVDMTNVIPLGAHVRNGACELYGMPTGNHTIIIENEDGPGSRDVDFTLDSGETYEVEVGSNFF